jgi:hypothetical protein
LIAGLLIAPLVIALPVLWARLGETGFVARNLDVLLIFVVAPFCAALWLGLGKSRRSRR